jgi:hypothetical protein
MQSGWSRATALNMSIWSLSSPPIILNNSILIWQLLDYSILERSTRSRTTYICSNSPEFHSWSIKNLRDWLIQKELISTSWSLHLSIWIRPFAFNYFLNQLKMGNFTSLICSNLSKPLRYAAISAPTKFVVYSYKII